MPDCPRRGHLDAHHIVHWVDGGATDVDNLICLCRFHHRWLHEGGWRIEITADGEIVFCAPDGRRISSRAPVIPGHRSAVDAHGRSARDGRCRWGGERLDLDDAIAALTSRRRRDAHFPGNVTPPRVSS